MYALVSFLLQLLKLVSSPRRARAYAAYKPEAVALYLPQPRPMRRSRMATCRRRHGEKPAAAAAPPRRRARRSRCCWLRACARRCLGRSARSARRSVASVALKSHFDATVTKVLVADAPRLSGRRAHHARRPAGAGAARHGSGAARKDEAQLEQATRDTNRYTDLVARAATRCSTSTTPRRGRLGKAAILGDHASIDNMKVALGWYTLAARSPAGRRRQHQGGNIVKAATPRRARARHHQPDLADLRRALGESKIPAGAARRDGERRQVVATPQARAPRRGRLALIDNTVDP